MSAPTPVPPTPAPAVPMQAPTPAPVSPVVATPNPVPIDVPNAPAATPIPAPSIPTPPATTAAPVAAPTPSPVGTTPAPVPAATPAPTQSVAEQAADKEKLKEAKRNYLWARISSIFGRLRRHVLFFIVCGLFAFSAIWIFATAWQAEKAGTNENWFHEFLALGIMVWALILFYYRLYRKSEVFQASLARREAAEKAAKDAKIKLEEEQKRQAFMGLIRDFQSAQSYEQISASMAKLLTVGLESTLLRQQAIDLLCNLNLWMKDHKMFLTQQSLIIWRLKSSLFEISERFDVDSATQDLSIKATNIIEAITKKHLVDFTEGRTKVPLDLSQRCIPTLTLTAQVIPPGSIKFDHSILWQASLAEGELKQISFAGSDLQGASLWRAKLDQVDFNGALMKDTKLRTNLGDCLNLTAEQFFQTKEWELCYLNEEQKVQFFSQPEVMPPQAQDTWDSAEPRRRKLYFKIIHEDNTIQQI